jgi:hypothetical protein
MSLLEMQRALCRLLTDEDFRGNFFADPGAACRGFELSPGERASLCDIDKKRVALHSHLLMSARITLALAAFPLTARLICREVEELTPVYCRLYPPVPAGGGAQAEEAARLFALLMEEQRVKSRWPPYFEDLLRYEECLFRLGNTTASWESCEAAWAANAAGSRTLTLSTARSFVPSLGSHAELQSFSYDIAALVQRLGEDLWPEDRAPEGPPAQPVAMLLFKERGSPTVSALELTDLSCRLVARCDGQRTVSQVIAGLASELGLHGDERTAFAYGALDVLRMLWESGALGFVAQATPDATLHQP